MGESVNKTTHTTLAQHLRAALALLEGEPAEADEDIELPFTPTGKAIWGVEKLRQEWRERAKTEQPHIRGAILQVLAEMPEGHIWHEDTSTPGDRNEALTNDPTLDIHERGNLKVVWAISEYTKTIPAMHYAVVEREGVTEEVNTGERIYTPSGAGVNAYALTSANAITKFWGRALRNAAGAAVADGYEFPDNDD